MKERFMKNGVFSLEYNKETLKDMVLTLQEENKQLKIQISAREEEYRELEDKYKELNKMCELYSKSLYNAELNQYKDNWNKLKESLKDVMNSCDVEDKDFIETILDIIHEIEQEIEQGSDK